jgi:hypothetical protein
MYVYVCAQIYPCLRVSIYVCVYMCRGTHMYMHRGIHTYLPYTCIYIYIYIYIYIWIYACYTCVKYQTMRPCCLVTTDTYFGFTDTQSPGPVRRTPHDRGMVHMCTCTCVHAHTYVRAPNFLGMSDALHMIEVWYVCVRVRVCMLIPTCVHPISWAWQLHSTCLRHSMYTYIDGILINTCLQINSLRAYINIHTYIHRRTVTCMCMIFLELSK